MDDINLYLKKILTTFNEYSVSADDKKAIKRDLSGFIAHKLFRKKFRKQKLFDSTAVDITNRIKLSVKNDKPLHIVIFFGGYKHFWNPSASEIDWAEVFNLNFLSEWAAPVVASYEPGVIIEFVSEDWILPKMNNYTAENLDKYSNSFTKLINLFNNKTPDNFKFKFTRLGNIYDKSKMLKMVEAEMPAGYKRWGSLLEESKQSELKRSLRSVILKEGQGIDRVIESRVMELAYYHVEERPEFSGDYFSNPEHIFICFSYGLSDDNADHWLTLGSTSASVVDFWIGRGILGEGQNGFVDRIVSKEQYEKIKGKLKTLKTGFDDSGLKNLRNIEIIDEKEWESLNFHL